MSLQTLNDIFFAVAGRDQPQAMLRKTARGWEPISSQEFTTKVGGVVKALSSFGISRGDRVADANRSASQFLTRTLICDGSIFAKMTAVDPSVTATVSGSSLCYQ